MASQGHKCARFTQALSRPVTDDIITVTPLEHFKSPAYRLFVEHFVQANRKESIKTLHHPPLCERNPPVHRSRYFQQNFPDRKFGGKYPIKKNLSDDLTKSRKISESSVT